MFKFMQAFCDRSSLSVVGIAAIAAIASAAPAFSQSGPIAYISSSTGYMLSRSGSIAVTANWNGQPPIDFSGYGQIRQGRLCLTGFTGNSPLTWQSCQSGNTSQRWGLEGGRLRNEGGWCADLEGNRNGPGVPVLAWTCTGSINQRWKAHYSVNANNVLTRISNSSVRQSLFQKIKNSSAGQVIRLDSAEVSALRSAGGAQLIGMDGATLIAAGSMNLIAAGGLN